MFRFPGRALLTRNSPDTRDREPAAGEGRIFFESGGYRVQLPQVQLQLQLQLAVTALVSSTSRDTITPTGDRKLAINPDTLMAFMGKLVGDLGAMASIGPMLIGEKL